MKKVLTMNLICFSCFSVSAHSAIFDISGINIGDDIEEAKPKIMSINEEYNILEMKDRNGNIFGISGSQGKNIGFRNNVFRDSIYIQFSNSNKVTFVGRAQNYIDGQRPAYNATIKAVLGKYGEPSDEIYNGLVWHYYGDGKQYKGPAKNGPCNVLDEIVNFQDINGITVPIRFGSECGKYLEVRYSKVENGLISNLTVRAIDSEVIYEEITAERKNEIEQKQKLLENEKSKNIRPNL